MKMIAVKPKNKHPMMTTLVYFEWCHDKVRFSNKEMNAFARERHRTLIESMLIRYARPKPNLNHAMQPTHHCKVALWESFVETKDYLSVVQRVEITRPTCALGIERGGGGGEGEE